MVVCCEMTAVPVTVVEVVCMEEQTALVCSIEFLILAWVSNVLLCSCPTLDPLFFVAACVCMNRGSCNGSVCACTPGYTGALCEAPCPTSCPSGYYQSNCSCGMSLEHAIIIFISYN